MKIVLSWKIFWLLVAGTLAISALIIGLVFGLRKSRPIVGAVVSNAKGCAEVGGQMFDNGGSAVDAAIATILCEGVLLPQDLGLGGGFMATIYKKSTGKIETLIARETAPAAATVDMFVGQEKITGATAGAVPAALLGYYEMHKKYGILDWKLLFEPAIKLCKEGHLVSEYLATCLKFCESLIRSEPLLAEVFVKEDGTLYQEGDTMKHTQLGATLEIIAEKGVAEFYGGGELGKLFVEDIRELGGIITEQDLKDYRVRWDDKAQVKTNVTGGYTLYTTPLPSSGAILVFILNVLSGLYTDDHDVFWQRVIETFKHAYGLRTKLGDLVNEPHMAPSIQETFDNLLSQDFAKQIRALIHDGHTSENISYYGANFTNEEDHGTGNVAVLAPNGDAISITSSIHIWFGSKVRSRRTGIILNSLMDDFSTPGFINSYKVRASPFNYMKPGKRPMSSMCPSIILDGEGNVRMLVGAGGGTKITTTVAAVIIKYLIFNQSIDEVVNDGRLHHQLDPMRVDYERSVPKSVQEYLNKVGHKLHMVQGLYFSALTAIGVRSGESKPIYDPRRGGSTATIKAKN